jgi:hypothetical protein
MAASEILIRGRVISMPVVSDMRKTFGREGMNGKERVAIGY